MRARRPKTHPHSRFSTYCDRQKLNGLNMKNQPGKDEKTEQRYVKDSHASGEITRPMFWKLLAQRPVLGQPDWLTKGLIRQISATTFRAASADFFALSSAYLHATGSANIHARSINRKTPRQLCYLFAHTLLHSTIAHMLEHIRDPIPHFLHLRFSQASRGY